jgi:hypothetical protein
MKNHLRYQFIFSEYNFIPPSPFIESSMKILDAWSIRFEIVLVFLSDGSMQGYSENCQKIQNLLTESEQYSSTIQENGYQGDSASNS